MFSGVNIIVRKYLNVQSHLNTKNFVKFLFILLYFFTLWWAGHFCLYSYEYVVNVLSPLMDVVDRIATIFFFSAILPWTFVKGLYSMTLLKTFITLDLLY